MSAGLFFLARPKRVRAIVRANRSAIRDRQPVFQSALKKMRGPKAQAASGPASGAAKKTVSDNALMTILDDLLGSKAPIQIPGKLKFLMAKFGHWLVIVLMVLALPGQLIGLGMRAAMLPFASMAGNDSSLKLAFALATLLFLIVILIMSLPGLQARKIIGWQLLILANAINLAYGILTGTIFGPVLGSIIGLYVLMQLRRYYMP